MNRDIFELTRFLSAQESVYSSVLRELRDGRKKSHWMWFVFPQIAGLGSSLTSVRYAIANLDEARAYASHPGSRGQTKGVRHHRKQPDGEERARRIWNSRRFEVLFIDDTVFSRRASRSSLYRSD